MNGISKTRFVTLMAAAASVTAGLGSSMVAPEQALARTPASAAMVSDTVPKAKPAATKKAATATAPKKAGAAAPAAVAKKPEAAAKPVVSTTASNAPSENDCGSEADCRNADGAGY